MPFVARPKLVLLLLVAFSAGCATAPRARYHPPKTFPSPTRPLPPSTRVPGQAVQCGDGSRMRVHFYDVGQGLAALIELPNGKLVLVDAGESPSRPACGDDCRAWHQHFMAKLHADVGEREISLLWNTHPHSDHMGGAEEVLEEFRVRAYADNGAGRDKAGVKRVLGAAASREVPVSLTAKEMPAAARLELSPAVQVRGVLPETWGVDCDKKVNDCSAGLRVDYCASSVLFVGDAEKDEEEALPVEHADVLQVGHHGSLTSSSEAFLARVTPKWAVISAGKRGEGTNAGFCHPRAATVRAVSQVLGDTDGRPVEAFDGESCKSGGEDDWRAVPASRRLFSTPRDGDVTLVTTGDGEFVRE